MEISIFICMSGLTPYINNSALSMVFASQSSSLGKTIQMDFLTDYTMYYPQVSIFKARTDQDPYSYPNQTTTGYFSPPAEIYQATGVGSLKWDDGLIQNKSDWIRNPASNWRPYAYHTQQTRSSYGPTVVTSKKLGVYDFSFRLRNIDVPATWIYADNSALNPPLIMPYNLPIQLKGGVTGVTMKFKYTAAPMLTSPSVKIFAKIEFRCEPGWPTHTHVKWCAFELGGYM